jgi:hypothetical protein
MLFKKLFQMLVVGGAVVGAASGCTPRAEAQSASGAKDTARDAGTAPDAGTKSAGGGVQGW